MLLLLLQRQRLTSHPSPADPNDNFKLELSGAWEPPNSSSASGAHPGKAPHVIFLCETICTTNYIDSLKSQFQLHGISVPPRGHSRELCHLWRWDISATIHSYYHRWIDSIVTTSEHLQSWRLTGAYGEPGVINRRAGWDNFKTLKASPNMAQYPWLCMGDFNEVLYQEEFKGSHTHA